MRFRTAIFQCAVLAGSVSASDLSGYLWTVDLQTPKYGNQQTESISSETAHAILARRRGMHSSEYLMTTDENVLADINQFGGFQQPLYQAGYGERPSKMFIRISGFDGGVSEFDLLPDLWIENPTRDLLDGFSAQSNVEGVCEYSIPKKDVDIIYSYIPEGETCMSQREVLQLPTVMALHATVPTAKTVGGKGMTAFLRTLIHFQSTSNIESTVLILPTPSKLAKGSKKVSKRSADFPEPEEEPLETAADPTQSQKSPIPQANTLANSSKPLPSFVPQCFSSNDTCMKTTNDCSGHGSCYKAHANCFKCRCGTTVVRENDDGTKKTVQWGGNACQKKDVSIPFFLFASFGVAFTAIIAGGIGMLYTMGSQELPSVIGAGVVGPRAQK